MSPPRKTEDGVRTNFLVNNFANVEKTSLAGKRILEIGCGRGNTAYEVAIFIGCNVVGVDIMQSPLWSEYKSPAVAFHKIDIATENHDFLGDFDFIYSFAVWEHIRHSFAALKAARKLLRPGDLVNLLLHAHLFAAAGVFRADGVFVELPPIPEALLEGGFRRAVPDFLVQGRSISEELRNRMLGWRYRGFSVHNQVRVAVD